MKYDPDMVWLHRSFWIAPLIIFGTLGLFALPFSRGRLHEVYRAEFQQPRQERLFLAWFAFFVSVLVVRGITEAIHHNIGPFHDVAMGGRHIHHMVWGILLLLLVGFCWLNEVGTGSADGSRILGAITSMLYGVGAALTLDEFALWLNLRDVYWQREGRESYEAMALFASFLALMIFGAQLLRGLGREIARVGRGRV